MFDFLSAADAYREPAGCRIEIEGEEIADLYPFISDVTVQASRSVASTATLKFEAPVDENGTWTVQDNENIFAGNTIRIDALFGTESAEVFRGFILQVSPSYPEDRGQSMVTVNCRDETLLLDQGHVRKIWGDVTPTSDGSIATEIALANSLSPAAGNQDGQSGLIIAQNGSDIDFLIHRAAENGYELYAREGELYFGPMQLGLDPQPTITVYGGKTTNCVSFDADDDAHHADQLTYDIASQTGASVESETIEPDLEVLGLQAASGAATSAGASEWRMSRTTTPNADQARAIAQAHVNSEAMRVSATGELNGGLYGHVLQFGQPVGVSGVGSQFGGRYYVDAVTHNFTPLGYRQNFTLIRNAFGDDLASSGGLLGAVLGG